MFRWADRQRHPETSPEAVTAAADDAAERPEKRRPRCDYRGLPCTDRPLSRAAQGTTSLIQSLPAETVEFSVSYASEKRMPFVRCKPQDWPFRVPTVANADLARRQTRHLDAVAIGKAQRTLYPPRTRSFWCNLRHRFSHRHTSPLPTIVPNCETT